MNRVHFVNDWMFGFVDVVHWPYLARRLDRSPGGSPGSRPL
jgi:hypothetical protein